MTVARLLCLAAVAASVSCARGTVTQATAPATGSYVPSPRESAFLDTLSRRTFDFFWETTNPRNGLTPDRWPTKSFS
ncbi:MAG: Tat pathway signal protein, partial [Gemmatimonadaceae bacterium]|nr:Tat pathway signal protein [Gemmatimonadaceae bacterium]